MPLITERLTLRVPEQHDLAALAEVFADPEAMRYIGTGVAWDESRMRESLDRKFAVLRERGFTFYTVVRRHDGRVLGDCGLNVWRDTGETEIGWRFAREHWGQGYATEAAGAVLGHARRDLGLTHLICMVDDENAASWRIAKRFGFAFDKMEQHHGRPVRRYVRTQ